MMKRWRLRGILTLDYLNNLDRIKVLEQKYENEIITDKEKMELISLYRTNNKIRKKNKKYLRGGDNMEDKKLPTLAEFLGWEEDTPYQDYNGTILKVYYNRLYYFTDHGIWMERILKLNDYETLRKAKKLVKEPKFYWKLKDEYSQMVLSRQYLNLNKWTNKLHLNNSCELKNYKTKFTEKEFNKLDIPKPFTHEMFEKELVEL